MIPSRLEEWKGRQESATDWVSRSVLRRFAATIDRQSASTVLNPLVHWLFFLPTDSQADLAVDGHPPRGGLMPPVELPRRMWAAGSLRFTEPLSPGQQISRLSTIGDVQRKTGRSGELVFVTVDHVVSGDDGPLVTETQTIVYRGRSETERMPAERPDAQGRQKEQPGPAAPWSRVVEPAASLLFRYSALTFNAHRIHYDRDYATGVEGYPGLVVHGPLVATLLMELFLEHNLGAVITGFDFRAVAPLFDITPFTLKGAPTTKGATLWAEDALGRICFTAEVLTDANYLTAVAREEH